MLGIRGVAGHGLYPLNGDLFLRLGVGRAHDDAVAPSTNNLEAAVPRSYTKGRAAHGHAY